jgi:predicted RNase H-like nuclease (RuvC/YqgF family)
LDLVEQYLSAGVTPTFLQEEAERTEQWRQDLTLQSQDLTRRHLEMEARREQIQTLEEDLKREKQQLEALAAQLKNKTDSESPDAEDTGSKDTD